MNYIETAWSGYAEAAMPADAGEVQIKETRQAFYAGALVMLSTLSQLADQPGRAESGIKQLQEELIAFRDSINQQAGPLQ